MSSTTSLLDRVSSCWSYLQQHTECHMHRIEFHRSLPQTARIPWFVELNDALGMVLGNWSPTVAAGVAAVGGGVKLELSRWSLNPFSPQYRSFSSRRIMTAIDRAGRKHHIWVSGPIIVEVRIFSSCGTNPKHLWLSITMRYLLPSRIVLNRLQHRPIPRPASRTTFCN